MGSSLANVIIVNVRLFRDAFKSRFREGVCTYIGVGCESEFLSLLCGCSLVYKVWIASLINAFRIIVICELRMSVYKGVM